MQNTHSKISNEVLEECFALYSENGWKLLWIAMKFDIYHTSLFYHIVKRGIVRKVPILTSKPEEVVALYKNRLRIPRKKRTDTRSTEYFDDDAFESVEKNYTAILKDSLRRKDDKPDTECSHEFWIKRCSLCSAILESDCQVNMLSSKEPVKFVYHELDTLVCNHDSSLELQQLGVHQNSMLYWIYFDDSGILTLRVKTNLPTVSNENAATTSAFTSQEIFKLLLKLPASMKDASFMNKLALNGNNPTYLAKLLIRCLRKFERQRGAIRKSIQTHIETTEIICISPEPENMIV